MLPLLIEPDVEPEAEPEIMPAQQTASSEGDEADDAKVDDAETPTEPKRETA